MTYENDINIVICGKAGQGIELCAAIVSKLLFLNNFHTFSTREYMSQIRGGSNSVLIKVTSKKAPFFSERIDVLFAFDKKAIEHLQKRIQAQTHIIETFEENNFFIIGYISALFKIEENSATELIKEHYKEKIERQKNADSFHAGYLTGLDNTDIQIKIPPDPMLKNEILLDGNDALALGCIAGDCNFMSFYPMSPATSLATFLIQQSERNDIITEQVEDEIAAINMALGASYAGARAIVPTAGGGFALMSEAVSLAGMTETPIVINIAQRPSPATGMPTRTAQEDLNLALYSGQGEFPRIILSPSTFEDSFLLGAKAFSLAAKFQVPVFLLSEQSFLESTFATAPFDVFSTANEYDITKSGLNYKRYELTQDGISPRSIPNYGDGVVCSDSDEHNEYGEITEDFEMRKKMTEKRLKKMELIRQDIIAPYFEGEKSYKYLIVSWGSNFYVLKNAIKNKKDFALLHFSWVYPLYDDVKDYFKRAHKLIIVEQNAYGQFANLLKQKFSLDFDYRFLKYDGMPFSSEEIEELLNEIR